MPSSFNDRLRQVILLLIITLLALLLLEKLYLFLPGFLGAVTIYILTRERYDHLTIKKGYNKTGVAVMFIIACMILIAVPVYFSIELLASKVSGILSNPAEMIEKAKLISKKIEAVSGYSLITDNNLQTLQQKATAIIPSLLNNSLNILSNFAILFFILYYFLKNGKETEQMLNRLIPLKAENILLLSRETKSMIRANAIGIPILAILQGVIATIGYAIFGVKDFGLWGFMTGICSMIPIVGTGLVWVPLVAYFFATGNNGHAIGLLIYSAVVLTNIDYVARLTILKKIMDIHPMITIFGVITGISLFGFWGVIFGPLLISYLIILVKIYSNEFVKPYKQTTDEH